MKIIEMCKVVEDGVPLKEEDGDVDPRDWFCVIETKEEEMVYDKAHTEGESAFYETIWDAMVNYAGQGMGVKWGDDDIYAYIRPDEVEPDLGETYKLDNDTWYRVA